MQGASLGITPDLIQTRLQQPNWRRRLIERAAGKHHTFLTNSFAIFYNASQTFITVIKRATARRLNRHHSFITFRSSLVGSDGLVFRWFSIPVNGPNLIAVV